MLIWENILWAHSRSCMHSCYLSDAGVDQPRVVANFVLQAFPGGILTKTTIQRLAAEYSSMLTLPAMTWEMDIPLVILEMDMPLSVMLR